MEDNFVSFCTLPYLKEYISNTYLYLFGVTALHLQLCNPQGGWARGISFFKTWTRLTSSTAKLLLATIEILLHFNNTRFGKYFPIICFNKIKLLGQDSLKNTPHGEASANAAEWSSKGRGGSHGSGTPKMEQEKYLMNMYCNTLHL